MRVVSWWLVLTLAVLGVSGGALKKGRNKIRYPSDKIQTGAHGPSPPVPFGEQMAEAPEAPGAPIGAKVSEPLDLPDIYIGDPLTQIMMSGIGSGLMIGPPISEAEKMAVRGRFILPGDPVYNSPPMNMASPITLAGLFEGDIVVASIQELINIIYGGRSAIRRRHWTGGIIPYVISDEYNSEERRVIAHAIVTYEDNTCIRIVPRTTEEDYIHIYKGSGCSSYVGRAGGRQGLSLARDCLYKGIVLHEMMHAAGFWHEQSRYDRDDHVRIMWDNIIEENHFNFGKQGQGISTLLGLAYDYASVMHYGPFAFAKDRTKPSIITKVPGADITYKMNFSQLDLQGLNILYKCPATVVTTPRPQITTRPPQPPPPPTRPTQPPTPVCRDRHRRCSYWARYGHCYSSSRFMTTYCPRSCQRCYVWYTVLYPGLLG